MGAEMILLGIRNTLPNWGTFTFGAPLPVPSRPLIHCTSELPSSASGAGQ